MLPPLLPLLVDSSVFSAALVEVFVGVSSATLVEEVVLGGCVVVLTSTISFWTTDEVGVAEVVGVVDVGEVGDVVDAEDVANVDAVCAVHLFALPEFARRLGRLAGRPATTSLESGEPNARAMYLTSLPWLRAICL